MKRHRLIVNLIFLSVFVPLRLAEVSNEEPTDDEVYNAIVTSMQQYYQRRGQPNPHSLVRHKRDEEVVCYDDLGCFRDEGPFDYLDTLPQSPGQIGTQFLLYTAANPETPAILHYANISSMYNSLFKRSHPTKVMVHGFGSSCQKQWAIEMRKALLQLNDVNVICVNWEEGASLPNYVQAAANTRVVGKQLAKFLRALNRFRGTNTTSFHLIGFSLGAHVAGFAGGEIKNLSRITGLDPAAPLYEGYSVKARLDPSDANFVDVIHSNGDSLLYGGLGAFEPMGHVDYYPNGGKEQGGCSNIFVGVISDIIWYQSKKSDGRSLCNHRRAYKFFADSVLNTCRFPAFACNDFQSFLHGDCFDCKTFGKCANMGYYSDQSGGRGKFFLLTRDKEPFCANQFKVVIESSSGLSPTYGALELTLINWNQRNETFQITRDGEHLLPGKPLTTVIVAHPLMNNPISAQVKYIPYKGWMTNGLERWAVDKITVINSSGQKYSFCRRGLPLAEGKPATVYLSHKQCDEGVLPSRPFKRKPLPLKETNLIEEETNIISNEHRNYSKIMRGPLPQLHSSKIIYGKSNPSNGLSVYVQPEITSRFGNERGVRKWRLQPPPPPPIFIHRLRPQPRSGNSGYSLRSGRTLSSETSQENFVRLVKWVPEARAQIVFIPKRLALNDIYIPVRGRPRREFTNKHVLHHNTQKVSML